MAQARVQGGLYYDAERREMQARDREMIPRKLVLAMAALALSALALVSYARIAGVETVGRPHEAPVIASRTVVLEGDGAAIRITDPDGGVVHDTENGAFIAVVNDALERVRVVHKIAGNPPVTIARHANGRLSLTDPATGWSTELTSFGAGNLRYWDVLFVN